MAYDPNTWFNPRFAIILLWKLRERVGERVINSSRFQKEREAWAVSTALLGISKITKEMWWIQIPKEDPPDISAMTLTPYEDENRNYINYRLVEVMEITKYTSNNIVNEILNKLENKYYEKETCLLVHMRRDESIKDMRVLSEELKKQIKGVADVWILGNEIPATNNFILFSLFPDVQVVRFDLDEEIPKLPLVNTIVVERGKGTGYKKIKGEMSTFNPQHKPIKEKLKK